MYKHFSSLCLHYVCLVPLAKVSHLANPRAGVKPPKGMYREGGIITAIYANILPQFRFWRANLRTFKNNKTLSSSRRILNQKNFVSPLKNVSQGS